MPYDPHGLFGSLNDTDLVEFNDTGVVVLDFSFNPRMEKVEKRGHIASVSGTVLSSVTCTAATDLLNKSTHGLTAGQCVMAAGFSAGLTAGTYYVIAVDSGTFKLATSPANAAAGTAVNISADGTGGTITPFTPASYRQIRQVQTHVIGAEIEMKCEIVPTAAGAATGLAALAPGDHVATIANFTTDDVIHGFAYDAAKLMLAGEIKQSRGPEKATEFTLPVSYYPNVAAPA